jgi:hypothetical protein
MSSLELPEEGDQEEARQLAERFPVELPKYRLERVHVATLNVDYAPPHGSGYARPLSEGRLARLRKEWDPLAVGPIVVSRRTDGTFWVIDGNHRRVIAFEKKMLQVPAMVLSGLERTKEADLYTKLGTVFGQTPATRFQSKLIAGDPDAHAIVRVMQRFGLTLASGSWQSSEVKAVARIEYIYARGGGEGLDWILALLTAAYPDNTQALTEMVLEGTFGFWYRYAKLVNREELARILQGAGLSALHDRADSTWVKIDLGPRSNTYGVAMAEMWAAATKKRLPTWERIQILPATLPDHGPSGAFLPRFRATAFYRAADDPAPQHLSAS